MAILVIFPQSSLRKQITWANYNLVIISQTISMSGNDRKVECHTVSEKENKMLKNEGNEKKTSRMYLLKDY